MRSLISVNHQDEFAMAHERDVDAVSKQLQVLKGEYTKLFGGANFIGVGDVHQIPPVVQYASDEQVVAASVVSWPGWKALWKVELQHAHRDGGDARHSRFVDRCGTGQLSQANTTEDCTGLVKLDGLRTVDDLDQLIDFVYPTPGSLEDHERAILSCKNESVDDINERVCSRLPGEWVECLSSDEVDGEDARDPLHMRGEDFLRTVSAWSFFARRLHGLTRMPLRPAGHPWQGTSAPPAVEGERQDHDPSEPLAEGPPRERHHGDRARHQDDVAAGGDRRRPAPRDPEDQLQDRHQEVRVCREPQAVSGETRLRQDDPQGAGQHPCGCGVGLARRAVFARAVVCRGRAGEKWSLRGRACELRCVHGYQRSQCRAHLVLFRRAGMAPDGVALSTNIVWRDLLRLSGDCPSPIAVLPVPPPAVGSIRHGAWCGGQAADALMADAD